MKCRQISTFLILISLFSLYLCLGQEKPTKQPPKEEKRSRHYVFNASIYYPFSINKSKKDSANINLSLFYGHVGRVKGIDLGAGVSVIKEELNGIQITGLAGTVGDFASGVQVAGLFNVAGDRLKGAQLAGLGNITGENGKGLQGAGLFNISGENFKGLQGAGILNIVGEHFKGIQCSGLFNIVGENSKGIQGSGLFNITGGDFNGVQATGLLSITGGNFNGVQAAGLFNVAGGTIRGLQTACANVAGHLLGLQVGIVNLAEKVSGVQVGIVNLAKRQEGIPLGLVNLAKNGRIRMTGWSSSVTAVNTGVKFMVNHLYSIISIGGINLYKDLSDSIAYGFHYGVHLPIKASRLFVDLDAGYMNIDNKTWFKTMKGTRDHQVLMLRGMLGIDISGKFSLFAGPGIRHLWDHGEALGKGQVKPMFIAGFEAF